MELIREKGKLTRLMILRELVIGSPKDQRSIADSIGVTPQAVSDYLGRMSDEGSVDLSERPPKATVKGVDILQKNLLQLKSFIDTTIERLDIIRSTDAIADAHIEKGEKVTLYMRNGLLYCIPGGDGCSTGKAEIGGGPGDLIMVSELNGMVEIPEHHLFICEILPARSGGGAMKIPAGSLDRFIVSRSMKERPKVAVLDLEAASLMLRSGIGFQMDLPEPRMVRTALDRGLTLICFGTPHSISRLTGSPEMDGSGLDVVELKVQELTY